MSEQTLEDKLLHHEQVNISIDLPFRQWLYAWLLDPKIEGNHQKSLDKWIVILIVAN